MLARTTKRIELFSGTCQLRLSDRVLDLRCALRVFQDYAGETPTLKRAVGRLEGIPGGGTAFAMMESKPLELTLEDGRRAEILFTDLQGNFTVTSPLG